MARGVSQNGANVALTKLTPNWDAPDRMQVILGSPILGWMMSKLVPTDYLYYNMIGHMIGHVILRTVESNQSCL